LQPAQLIAVFGLDLLLPALGGGAVLIDLVDVDDQRLRLGGGGDRHGGGEHGRKAGGLEQSHH